LRRLASAAAIAFGRSLLSLISVLLSSGVASATPNSYEIDPASSELVIHIGKAGVFRFAGHEHEVIARVQHGAVIVDTEHFESSSLGNRPAKDALPG
jgi:hypothetical protein